MQCQRRKNVNHLFILIILLKYLFAFINCVLSARRTSQVNMNFVCFLCPNRVSGLDITKARFGDAKSQRSLWKQAKTFANITFWIGIYPLYPFGLCGKYEYYFRNLTTLTDLEGLCAIYGIQKLYQDWWGIGSDQCTFHNFISLRG